MVTRASCTRPLHQPAVAVGVVEGQERGVVPTFGVLPRRLIAHRTEVVELVDIYTSLDQLGTSSFDVGDDQVPLTTAGAVAAYS